MAILQHTATEIAARDDGSVTRPRDLDGKLYAGFGLPQEAPELQAVIRADGGKGDFRTATLDTAAYEALYGGKADFTITFSAWEALEAAERGIKLRTFAFTDYGLPDSYAVVLVCNDDWLTDHADVARRFLTATVRGFELAASDPADGLGAPHRGEPRGLRREPEAADRLGHLPRRAAGSTSTATDGSDARRPGSGPASRLPLRDRAAGRTGREAAHDEARLLDLVHERLPAVTDGAGSGSGAGGGRVVRRTAPALGLLALLVLAWEIGCRWLAVDPLVLPAPSRILSALWDARAAAAGHTLTTLGETVIGFSISVVFAVAVALLMDQVGWVRRAVYPLLVTSQTIPIVAIAPLFLLWFGIGLLPKVLVVVLVTFFPVTVALLDGLAGASREATELLASFGASRRDQLLKLRLPGRCRRSSRGCGSR